jgi:hypothetical protein
MKLTGQIGPFAPGHTYLVIDAANVGRRPVVLTTAWLRTFENGKGYHQVIVSQWIPKGSLAEGKSATLLCKQNGLNLQSIRKVEVRDATGRVWSTRFQQPKQIDPELLKDIKVT